MALPSLLAPESHAPASPGRGHGHERAAVLLRAPRATSQPQNRSLGQERSRRQLREAREAHAVCSQVRPEHRNRAPPSDGVLTISRRRRRLGKITVGLVCKERKNTGLSAVPFRTFFPPPPQTSVHSSPAAFGSAFLPFMPTCPAQVGTNSYGPPGRSCSKKGAAGRGARSPSSPTCINGASLAWGLGAAWRLPQPLGCRFTRAAMQTALRIASHTHTQPGHGLAKSFGLSRTAVGNAAASEARRHR